MNRAVEGMEKRCGRCYWFKVLTVLRGMSIGCCWNEDSKFHGCVIMAMKIACEKYEVR